MTEAKIETHRHARLVRSALRTRRIGPAPRKAQVPAADVIVGRTSWHIIANNPLIALIVGGLITALTGIYSTSQTARLNRDADLRKSVEARRATSETFQGELIKKFVEGTDQRAIRENLKFLTDAGLIPSYSKQISQYLSRNPDSSPTIIVANQDSFTASEMAKQTGVSNVMTRMAEQKFKLLKQMIIEPLESRFGKPVEIVSGYRSPAVNRLVGGTPKSSHAAGEAIDIRIDGITLLSLACWVQTNLVFDQVIIESTRQVVHISYKATGSRHQSFIQARPGQELRPLESCANNRPTAIP